MNPTDRRRLVTGSCGAILFGGLCASSASVVLPLLRSRYALSYDFSGLLLALLSVGNLAAGLLSSFLPRYLGRRGTMMLLCIGYPIGYWLLASFGISGILCLSFLFIGLAKGSSMNHVTVNMGQCYEDKTKGVSILNALFATGSLLAPVLYFVFGSGSLPWRTPLIVLGFAGTIVWLFLFFSEKPAPVSASRAAAKERDDWSFLKNKHYWFCVLFLFGQQCAEISVTGWLVTYFKDTGILAGPISEFTVTIVWTSMLIGRLILAFVLPQGSRLRSPILISTASIVTYLMLLGSSSSIPALISLFLFGLSISGAYPTGIANAGKMSSASIGIMLPTAGIGAIVMPYITGAVAGVIGIHGGMMCSLAALGIMLLFSVLQKVFPK